MGHEVGDAVLVERMDGPRGLLVEAYEVVAVAPGRLTLRHVWTERRTENGIEREPGLLTIEVRDPREIKGVGVPIAVRWAKGQ